MSSTRSVFNSFDDLSLKIKEQNNLVEKFKDLSQCFTKKNIESNINNISSNVAKGKEINNLKDTLKTISKSTNDKATSLPPTPSCGSVSHAPTPASHVQGSQRSRSLFSPLSSPDQADITPAPAVSAPVPVYIIPDYTEDNSDNLPTYSKTFSNTNVNKSLTKALAVRPPKKSIFVSRFLAETTCEEILDFIKCKIPNAFHSSIQIFKYKFSTERDISSFKILVPMEVFDAIVRPSFWPTYTVVHEFKYKAKNRSILTKPSSIVNSSSSKN